MHIFAPRDFNFILVLALEKNTFVFIFAYPWDGINYLLPKKRLSHPILTVQTFIFLGVTNKAMATRYDQLKMGVLLFVALQTVLGQAISMYISLSLTKT